MDERSKTKVNEERQTNLVGYSTDS